MNGTTNAPSKEAKLIIVTDRMPNPQATKKEILQKFLQTKAPSNFVLNHTSILPMSNLSWQMKIVDVQVKYNNNYPTSIDSLWEQWWFYGGPGEPRPPRNFLSPFVGLPLLWKSIKFWILNILFTANTCELGKCTRDEHRTSRLLLYFNLCRTSL